MDVFMVLSLFMFIVVVAGIRYYNIKSDVHSFMIESVSIGLMYALVYVIGDIILGGQLTSLYYNVLEKIFGKQFVDILYSFACNYVNLFTYALICGFVASTSTNVLDVLTFEVTPSIIDFLNSVYKDLRNYYLAFKTGKSAVSAVNLILVVFFIVISAYFVIVYGIGSVNTIFTKANPITVIFRGLIIGVLIGTIINLLLKMSFRPSEKAL